MRTSRRTFLGQLAVALVGLVGLGFTRRKAKDELTHRGLETVKAEPFIPARLARFNCVQAVGDDGRVVVHACRPPSDLDQQKLQRELRTERIVQTDDGQCCRLTPREVSMDRIDWVHWDVSLQEV